MAWHASLLVIANVTAASADLLAALQERAGRGPIDVFLLMPASGGDARAGAEARERLGEVLAGWREAGLQADGAVGDPDPLVAVEETWDPRRFDEVVVSTLPGQSSKWLRSDLPHRVARLTDAQVLHVVAMDMRRRSGPGAPPPERERSALGPLSVLSWGGRPDPGRPHAAGGGRDEAAPTEG